ncbi:hypothetical protein Plec18167_005586 [Paecilomyces lecythidis]|uniref:Uncharacterized protein n=1 Tax=Paecilomyces lecythidis TaxID=3004212 RepID=A0ABR3XI79_9EURO
MTSFVEDLWSSIFTPGPTSTLLVATNATFAALQVLLFALLLATYSIHFVILSFLSGSLWWSINWFAREVRETQAREDEKTKQREGKTKSDETRPSAALDNAGSDTETESLAGSRRLKGSSQVDPSGAAAGKLGSSSEDEQLRKRRSLGESSGYVSTDSEWEKVDDKNA